jgi:hypothetical protein
LFSLSESRFLLSELLTFRGFITILGTSDPELFSLGFMEAQD